MESDQGRAQEATQDRSHTEMEKTKHEPAGEASGIAIDAVQQDAKKEVRGEVRAAPTLGDVKALHRCPQPRRVVGG